MRSPQKTLPQQIDDARREAFARLTELRFAFHRHGQPDANPEALPLASDRYLAAQALLDALREQGAPFVPPFPPLRQ